MATAAARFKEAVDVQYFNVPIYRTSDNWKIVLFHLESTQRRCNSIVSFSS